MYFQFLNSAGSLDCTCFLAHEYLIKVADSFTHLCRNFLCAELTTYIKFSEAKNFHEGPSNTAAISWWW